MDEEYINTYFKIRNDRDSFWSTQNALYKRTNNAQLFQKGNTLIADVLLEYLDTSALLHTACSIHSITENGLLTVIAYVPPVCIHASKYCVDVSDPCQPENKANTPAVAGDDVQEVHYLQ